MRLTVDRRKGHGGRRALLQLGEEWVILGELNDDELRRLRGLVKDGLSLWDTSLEIWVPTPSLLFRLNQSGLPDLSTVKGFRRLAEFHPLAAPVLDDPWLWKRTTLGSVTGGDLVFAVRKEEGTIYWLLPVGDRAFFKLRPAVLTAIEPGLFAALGIDRLIDFLRGSESSQGGISPPGTPSSDTGWVDRAAPTLHETRPPGTSPSGTGPGGSRAIEDPPVEETGGEPPRPTINVGRGRDLPADPNDRDLREDGRLRDLRRDPGMQDRLRDLGARESFQLGAPLMGQLPLEVLQAIASGRSAGFATARRRSDNGDTPR